VGGSKNEFFGWLDYFVIGWLTKVEACCNLFYFELGLPTENVGSDISGFSDFDFFYFSFSVFFNFF